MPLPALEPRDAIAIVTAVVTVSGVVFALRSAVSRLEVGQSELLRQMSALHKRMDHYGAEIVRIDKEAVRLTERIEAIRDAQRLFSARRDAGESPAHQE